AGHGLAARPPRDAYVQRVAPARFRCDRDLDGAIPRIAGLLDHPERAAAVHLHFRRAGDEEVDVEDVSLLGVDVAGHRGQETRHVARAAGDTEPGAALVLARRLKGVRVEE